MLKYFRSTQTLSLFVSLGNHYRRQHTYADNLLTPSSFESHSSTEEMVLEWGEGVCVCVAGGREWVCVCVAGGGGDEEYGASHRR